MPASRADSNSLPPVVSPNKGNGSTPSLNGHTSNGSTSPFNRGSSNGAPNGLGAPRRSLAVSVLSGKASQMSTISTSYLNRPDIEITFKDKLDKRFECPVCCQVLRYPVQFDCGHRCCSSCLPELLRFVAKLLL